MKKRLLLIAAGILWVLVAPTLKALPVIGGLIGFIEFLAFAILVGAILYHIGLYIYLWFKVRRRD